MNLPNPPPPPIHHAGPTPGQFPDAPTLAAQIIKVDTHYAEAGVSREKAPDQISNYLEFCGLPRDPSISFCAAGGSYGIAHAYCDVMGIFYSPQNAVEVFRRQIPVIEQHWLKVSASCEEIRLWAIARGKWVPAHQIPQGMVFKPAWVGIFNYETQGPEAHHYATIISGNKDDGVVHTAEFNTSSNVGAGVNQAHGGAVALKTRYLNSIHFRGIIRTY